jgi:hypothetical protein
MTELIEGEIIEPSTDLVSLDTNRLPISFVEDPEQFLEDATAQAKVLKNFLLKTNSVVKIGPSEHVRVGGWQFLAQLAGLSVGTSAEAVTLEDGDTGWKGHAILYKGGEQIGEADALCLRSERNWKNSDTYAICSMAQTRAISKAIKGVLGFVVVMAGYSDTPAEEMPRPARPSRSSAQKTELPGDTFADIFEPGVSNAKPVNASTQQKKKLDVLVGQLRDKELVHTEHLYQAVANMRDAPVDLWVEGVKLTSDDGELHWGPLRDSLSKEEASNLIDRLSRFEATIGEKAAG